MLPSTNDDAIVLAGTASNLCVESHATSFSSAGFEVVVVRAAITAPNLPNGDGYSSALVNSCHSANDVVTTDEAVAY